MPVFYRKDMMPMSQFSELLREYIKKKDITIKALAEKCGIDRTYLHKILKGERKVPSVDFVENISLQLMLSTEDKSRLMELYNISEMGEDVYNRRKQVSKIIHDMANTNMEDPDALTFKTEVDITLCLRYPSIPTNVSLEKTCRYLYAAMFIMVLTFRSSLSQQSFLPICCLLPQKVASLP